MGRLEFPHGSVVYVDTSAIIYSVERVENYWQLLLPMWEAADAEATVVVTSNLSITECLVKPLRCHDVWLEGLYREFLFNAKKLSLMPLDQPLLEQAAAIRAHHRLSTPDAIHAATAVLARVSAFVTNDTDFLRIAGLNTMILSHLTEQKN